MRRSAVVAVLAFVIAGCGPTGQGGPVATSAANSPALRAADVRGLFPGAPEACDEISCLLDFAFAADPEALRIARSLYASTGNVAGLGTSDRVEMNGGVADMAPQLPVGPYRGALVRSAEGLRWMDQTISGLAAAGRGPIEFRARNFGIAYLRSVEGRRPSGWVSGGSPFGGAPSGAPLIHLNVVGSLTDVQTEMSNLLVHEIFHWLDLEKGGWSEQALGTDVAAILDRCGGDQACLAPYSPTTLRLGGRLYALDRGNAYPVREYAAEVAVRYFRDQSTLLAGGTVSHPWKCLRSENGRSWSAFADAFFAGRDLLPPCR